MVITKEILGELTEKAKVSEQLDFPKLSRRWLTTWILSLLKKVVDDSDVDLQVTYPEQAEYDIEQLLFEHRLNKELSVETGVKLPETLEDFKQKFRKDIRALSIAQIARGMDSCVFLLINITKLTCFLIF